MVRGRRLEARDGLGHRDELVGRARILVRGSRAIAGGLPVLNDQVVEPPRGWTRPLSVAPVSLTDVAGSVIPQADSPNARPQPSTNRHSRTSRRLEESARARPELFEMPFGAARLTHGPGGFSHPGRLLIPMPRFGARDASQGRSRRSGCQRAIRACAAFRCRGTWSLPLRGQRRSRRVVAPARVTQPTRSPSASDVSKSFPRPRRG